jgi:putative ABC transport system permease protein
MRHIIKPLLRHRLMPLLVVLQVAIACAIACNALFLLQQKLVPILASDGVGHPDHLIVASQIVAHGQPWTANRMHATALALRAIPGVTSVSAAGSLPMVTSARFAADMVGVGSGVKTYAGAYIGTHLVQTLDLKLVAGRDFSANEESVQYEGVGFDKAGPAIITQALANKLFPGQSALGKHVRIGKDADSPQRIVVGVVAHLMRNDFAVQDHPQLDATVLIPGIPNHWPIGTFAVRARPAADPSQVMRSVKKVIQRTLGTSMAQGIKPTYDMYAQLRNKALAKSRAAVWLLAGVCLIVLIVTAAGIMGLTSYWVGQRRRQIGIRRALGARRRNILHDLQWENLMVVGVGVLLGLAAAYGINLWLMHHYELSRLPWQYLPMGAALLLALGQLAVLAPALRAANVPPVVATRSA